MSLTFNSIADKVKQIQRPFTVDIYAFGIFCLEILSDLGKDHDC